MYSHWCNSEMWGAFIDNQYANMTKQRKNPWVNISKCSPTPWSTVILLLNSNPLYIITNSNHKLNTHRISKCVSVHFEYGTIQPWLFLIDLLQSIFLFPLKCDDIILLSVFFLFIELSSYFFFSSGFLFLTFLSLFFLSSSFWFILLQLRVYFLDIPNARTTFMSMFLFSSFCHQYLSPSPPLYFSSSSISYFLHSIFFHLLPSTFFLLPSILPFLVITFLYFLHFLLPLYSFIFVVFLIYLPSSFNSSSSFFSPSLHFLPDHLFILPSLSLFSSLFPPIFP